MAQHPTGAPPDRSPSDRGESTGTESGRDPGMGEAEPSGKATVVAKPVKPAERRAVQLEPADVAAYLRRNPDFLARRPDLIAVMTPPERDMGDGVVDMQRFMLERLRTDVARLKLVQRKLIATSRSNQANQARVHAAVLALLGATTFEHLIAVITDDLTMLLDIDAVGLCVEATHGASDKLVGGVGAAGLQVLEEGSVDELLGPGHDVLLRDDVIGDPAIFGAAAAGLVRSDALVRLRVSSAAPVGLLALGARRPGVFQAGQGTELLSFLAQVIEHSIRAWLDLPE